MLARAPLDLRRDRWWLVLVCILLLPGFPSQLAGQISPVVDLPGQRSAIRTMILDGRVQPALDKIQSLRQQHSSDPGLALLEGEAFYAIGLLERAVDAFRNGLELDPEMKGKLFNLGRALQDLGRDREALQVFASMQQRPETSLQIRGLFGAALSHQNLGESLKAKNLYRQALDADPDFDRARYRLALLIIDEQPQEALQMLDAVLARDPLHHGSAYNRALALRNLGRVEDARQAMLRYQTILEGRSRIAMLKERWATDPANIDLMMELGRTHDQLGALSEALRWFGKAAGAHPGDPRPPLATIRTLLAAGRVVQARQLVSHLQGSAVASRAQALIEEFEDPPAPPSPVPPNPPSQDR
jgi:tetratricopeptide (TPR) repeat protein